MATADLIEEAISNPPYVEEVEENPVDDSLAVAREEGFLAMAHTYEEFSGASLIQQANRQEKQRRLQQEALVRRKEEVADIEQEIMSSDMPPEATFATLRDIREGLHNGLSIEELAVEELSAKNILLAEDVNQQDIAFQQAIEDKQKHETAVLLANLRNTVEKEFKSTIPGIEDAYEWLTSAILFPKSGGTNVAGLMEDTFGINVGLFESLAPGDRIIELQKIWSTMSGADRSAAIKRAHTSIQKRAGIIFDNESDAMVMMNALEAIAGSRVQAEAARVSGTWGQWIDVLLTVAGAVPLKALKAGVKVRKADIALEAPVSPSKTLSDEVVPSARVARDEAVAVFTGTPVATAVQRALNYAPRPKDTPPWTGLPAFSPAQVMNQVSPKTAAPIFSAALKDMTGEITVRLGATKAQIADETIAPLITGGPIRKGATLIQPAINNVLNDAGSSVVNLMRDSKLYTAKEIDKVQKDLSSVLDDLDSDEITLVNKSEPIVDESFGTVSMRYTIGAGEGNSFSTAQEAKDFITRLPTSRLDDFQVMKYVPSINEYRPFTGELSERGEFLLSARYTANVSDGAVKEYFLRTEANFFTNHVDHSVQYIDRFSKSISRLDIRQAQIQGAFKEILKPLEKLKKTEDLDAVWQVLKEAEKNPVDFNSAQLSIKLGGNQQRVAAYRSVRRFYQAVYEIRNRHYRSFLSKRGYLMHKHTDGTSSWVKPVGGSQAVSVYWDEAGSIISKRVLEDSKIDLEIFESFKPRRIVQDDGTIVESKYIAVRKGKSDLQPLPTQVLHNKETYLGRHMQTNYVIEEMKDAIVNGEKKKVAQVLAVANNPVDAAKEAAKSPNYRMRRAIETTESNESFLSQELSFMHDMQMLTNTNNRLDFNALDITRQESIVSPAESLDRVRNTMARTASLNEWIEYATLKWERTYGDLFEQKGFPWGGPLNLKAGVASDMNAIRRLNQARKVRERILLTSGMHSIQIAEKIQQSVMGAGEYLSRAAANMAKKGDAGKIRDMKVGTLQLGARAVSTLAHVDPVTKAKWLAHFSFIVANPIRQLVMQSSAALIYSGVQHGSKYMATGHAARDFAFLATAKSLKDIDPDGFQEVVKKYAKVAGISKKEADKFYDDFLMSGTFESVTSHQFLEHGFRAGGSYANHAGTYARDELPNVFARTANRSKNSFRQAERSLSHYGFEAGEKAHRLAAYLAVRNKHAVNGTLKDMDPTELGVEGIRLAGNMGVHSKNAFQTGVLGLPFQFMQHTTRMVQYMLPRTKWTSWVASDVLSNREKAQVGLWSAAMYGVGGFGIGSLFIDGAKNQGIEIDPLVQDALEEGLAGLAFESMIEGMTGSEANINVSGSIAPLSGITGDVQILFGKDERAATPLGQAYKVLANFATGMPVDVDNFLGATSGVGSKATGIVGNIKRIWANPVLGTGEKLELQVQDIASFLPIVNNVFQGRLMAATGEYVTKYGTPIAQVTLGEAMSRALIGVGPAQVDDVFALNAEMRGKKANLLAPSHGELSSSGKDVANFTYHAFQRLYNGEMSDEQVMNRIEAVRAATFLAYQDQTDRDIVQAAMRKELIRLMGSKETLADELVKLMADDFELSHELGWDRLKTKINKVGPSEYKEHVLKEIERIQANESGSVMKFEPTE